MCYLKEGMAVKLTPDFLKIHPNAPVTMGTYFGEEGTIQRLPNQDNSEYLIAIRDFRYQVPARCFAVKAQFKQASHDLKWEFTVSGFRAAVVFPDVMFMTLALDYGRPGVVQERWVRADLFDAMRKEQEHAVFVVEHQKMYAPQAHKRATKAHF